MFSEVFDCIVFQCCGEQYSLFVLVSFIGDGFDILGKIYIQYVVGFIEDQGFDGVVVEIFFFNILQQVIGGGDYDVLVFVEYFCVVYVCYVVGNGGDVQMGMFCQFVGVVGYLYCQFMGWCQDKNVWWVGFFMWEIEQVL